MRCDLTYDGMSTPLLSQWSSFGWGDVSQTVRKSVWEFLFKVTDVDGVDVVVSGTEDRRTDSDDGRIQEGSSSPCRVGDTEG